MSNVIATLNAQRRATAVLVRQGPLPKSATDKLEERLSLFFEMQWCSLTFQQLLDFNIENFEYALAHRILLPSPSEGGHDYMVRAYVSASAHLKAHCQSKVGTNVPHDVCYSQCRLYAAELFFRDALLWCCQYILSQLAPSDRRDWKRKFSDIILMNMNMPHQDPNHRIYQTTYLSYPTSMLMIYLCQHASPRWQSFKHFNTYLTWPDLVSYFERRIRLLSDDVVRNQLAGISL